MNDTTESRVPVADALTCPGRPRVMFGLPTRDEVKMDFALSLAGICVRSCLVVDISTANPRSCYVQINRNDIVKEAFKQQCEWIMWIDADIEAPIDGLLRLMSHNQDIVGATYVRRSEPYQLMGRAVGRKTALPMEGLVEMSHIPTGFLLTRVEVFRKIEPPWFWVTHHPNGDVDLGDDYYFCDKAVKAGISIWLDTALTAEIKHHGDVGIGANGLAPRASLVPGVAAQ